MGEHVLDRTLRVDGFGCPSIGVAFLAAAGPIAGNVGLDRAWPIVALGVVLIAYGIENLLIARRPHRATVGALIVIDLSFAAGVLAIAALDPWGASGLARAAMVALGLASATMGALKRIGLPEAPALAGRDMTSVPATSTARRARPGAAG